MDQRYRLALPRSPSDERAMSDRESQELERWANTLPFSAWQDYDPNIGFGNSSPSLTNIRSRGRWRFNQDATVGVQFELAWYIDGAPSAGALTFAFPVTPVGDDFGFTTTTTTKRLLGQGVCHDTSAFGTTPIFVSWHPWAALQPDRGRFLTTAGAGLSDIVPFTWAVGDHGWARGEVRSLQGTQ